MFVGKRPKINEKEAGDGPFWKKHFYISERTLLVQFESLFAEAILNNKPILSE